MAGFSLKRINLQKSIIKYKLLYFINVSTYILYAIFVKIEYVVVCESSIHIMIQYRGIDERAM